MGELKIIIWIVLGIIYLVSRARKKQAPSSTSTPQPAEEYQEDKPISFDDLLKEIQAAKTPKVQPHPVLKAEPEMKTVDYDDDLAEERQPVEDTNYDYRKQDTIYETYEKARQEAFLRPSMEETMKLENTIDKFGQFKKYEQVEKQNLAVAYAKDLRDPASFKKAFILSEILNRRY